MIDIWKKTELEKLMRKHKLYYSKSYGQNFLIDKNILEKIANAAEIEADDHLIEIGPGVGTLTIFLAQVLEKASVAAGNEEAKQSGGNENQRPGGCVTAIEIDDRLIPALNEVIDGFSNIKIINQNFMKYKLPGTGYKIIGNIPYYITTPIIAKLYEPLTQGDGKAVVKKNPSPPDLAVLTMQKEVAERILSPPGKKTYGAISVLVQYYADVEFLFGVSREVFMPKPKVDSSVIKLKPKDLTADDPAVTERMFRLVRAGFDMRRKTLRNSFKQAGFLEQDLTDALRIAEIDPVRRAETLSPREFYKIASFL